MENQLQQFKFIIGIGAYSISFISIGISKSAGAISVKYFTVLTGI
jgi:hypothetical protein